MNERSERVTIVESHDERMKEKMQSNLIIIFDGVTATRFVVKTTIFNCHKKNGKNTNNNKEKHFIITKWYETSNDRAVHIAHKFMRCAHQKYEIFSQIFPTSRNMITCQLLSFFWNTTPKRFFVFFRMVIH